MTWLGNVTEDDILDFTFTTAINGVPTTLGGTPALSAYETNSVTQSTSGITLTADFDSVTGLNHVRIDLSAAAFYAVGKDYSIVITTGTVDSTSVVGTVVAQFSIESRFDEADVTQWLGTAVTGDGDWAELQTDVDAILVDTGTSGVIVTGTPDVNVAQWNGSAVAVPTTAGVPEVDVTFAAGTAVQAASGRFQTDVELVAGFSAAGQITGYCQNAMGVEGGSVNDASPTAGSFVVSLDSTVDDFYNGATIIFTVGDLLYQGRTITDYTGATKTATFAEPFTSAPANGNTFVLLPNGAVPGGALSAVLRLFLTILDQSTGQIDAGSFAAGAIDAAAIATDAVDADALAADAVTEIVAGMNDPTAAAIADAVWDEAQGDHVAAGSFGETATEIASILADTGTDGVVLAADAVDAAALASDAGTEIADAILTRQMTESYAANGVAPTTAQAIFAIHQMLQQFAISGTSVTVRQLDNTTTAFVVTLDDATNPTSAVRV